MIFEFGFISEKKGFRDGANQPTHPIMQISSLRSPISKGRKRAGLTGLAKKSSASLVKQIADREFRA